MDCVHLVAKKTFCFRGPQAELHSCNTGIHLKWPKTLQIKFSESSFWVGSYDWRKLENFVSAFYCVRTSLLKHLVSEFYYVGPMAEIRYRDMPVVQLAAGGRQVAPTFPLIDARLPI